MGSLQEIALQMLVLGVCGAAILYLLRIKLRKRTILSFGGPGALGNVDQLLLQVARKSESSFERLSQILATEQQLLRKFIEKQSKKEFLAPPPEDNGKSNFAIGSPTLQGESGDVQESTDPYAIVARLSDLGLSVKEIAEKVRIPRGEIALVVKVQRKPAFLGN